MRQWSGVFVAAVVATTAALGAQGNQSPANTPPADAAAPPGIQQPALPAPAQAKGNTVTTQRLHPGRADDRRLGGQHGKPRPDRGSQSRGCWTREDVLPEQRHDGS